MIYFALAIDNKATRPKIATTLFLRAHEFAAFTGR